MRIVMIIFQARCVQYAGGSWEGKNGRSKAWTRPCLSAIYAALETTALSMVYKC